MEIDFLGLNSPTLKQEKPNNPYIDAEGAVEISLSLSTTSSLNFSERKKWEFAVCDKMICSSCSGTTVCSLPSNSKEKKEHLLLVAPPVFRPTAVGGFLYDLNDAAATVNLRIRVEISVAQSPSHVPGVIHTCNFSYLCRNMSQRTCPNEPDKVDENKVYISGNATTAVYTPTVAMARRATLARFLEKRLHRMNQARASHIMGKRSTNSQPCLNKNNKP